MTTIELRPENALQNPVKRYDIFIEGFPLTLGMWTWQYHALLERGVYLARDVLGTPLLVKGSALYAALDQGTSKLLSTGPENLGPVTGDPDGIQRITEGLLAIGAISRAISEEQHRALVADFTLTPSGAGGLIALNRRGHCVGVFIESSEAPDLYMLSDNAHELLLGLTEEQWQRGADWSEARFYGEQHQDRSPMLFLRDDMMALLEELATAGVIER